MSEFINFLGTWYSLETYQLIKISGSSGSDTYRLQFNFDGEKFLDSKEIEIFKSHPRHSLLAKSKVFGRNIIYSEGPDKFRVADNVFLRHKDEKSNIL